MKNRNIFRAFLLALGMILTVGAEDSISRSRPKDDDKGTPAAPEPAQLFLLAGGLAAVGVYVAWRQRRSLAQNVS